MTSTDNPGDNLHCENPPAQQKSTGCQGTERLAVEGTEAAHSTAKAKKGPREAGGTRTEASGVFVVWRSPLTEYDLPENLYNHSGEDTEFLKLVNRVVRHGGVLINNVKRACKFSAEFDLQNSDAVNGARPYRPHWYIIAAAPTESTAVNTSRMARQHKVTSVAAARLDAKKARTDPARDACSSTHIQGKQGGINGSIAGGVIVTTLWPRCAGWPRLT
eukprot:4570530-Pleurochrysis_carterae.AAC.2